MRKESASSMFWVVLMVGLYPLIKFSRVGVNFLQLIFRLAEGEEAVMGELQTERRIRLWFGDRSLM